MINVKNLNKTFNKGRQNEIHVIDNTTLQFPETGLVAITGPSGCGKTTLLNTIVGLDRFDKGEIDFDNIHITSYIPAQWDIIRNKYVGYIFQNYYLLTDKTVSENVEISLNMAGLYDKDQIEERINYVLESVGMYHYRRRNVQALSGGQQQRVAIARAIAKNPKVVLADEPTGNLDVNNTFEIMSIIKKISQTCLVILVSHEKGLVDFYADRVIEIMDGKVVKDYQNEGNRTLEHVDNRNIYLKDLSKITGNTPIEVEYYTDNEDADKPTVKLIYSNNTLYVKADALTKIKYLTEDTDIRLIDSHYRKPETQDATQHTFDLEQFKPIEPKSERTSFIRFRDTIKTGFSKLFRKRKLVSKMFLVAYFIISCLIVYNLATITNLLGIRDEDFLSTGRNFISLTIDREMAYDDVIDILDSTSVTGISYYPNSRNVNVVYNDFYQAGLDKGYYYSEYVYAHPVTIEQADDPELVEGRLPENNREVAIDVWLADDILNTQTVVNLGGSSYKDLLGAGISNSRTELSLSEVTIVGIVRTESPIMVLSNDNLGFFASYSGVIPLGMAAGYYTLQEGRNPQFTGEVIVSTEEDLSIGDLIGVAYGDDLEVVGIYGSADFNYRVVTEDQLASLAIHYAMRELDYYWSDKVKLLLTSPDNDTAIAEIEAMGYEADNVYQVQRDQHIANRQSQVAGKLRTILISIVGSLIYLVIMMRSSMLGRVKEIGVYRSIGATKRDVYKIFIAEILAFTTVASLIGYLVMSFLIIQIQQLNPLATNEFYFPFHIFIAGITGIYLMNLIFGMLPVFSLLRKTPAEINAKYEL
ncbi:MAG: ABC transporter ATP-binding protein/permease [Candidatus Izemoplasmatales bacterium]|nr:ABC transporter ATP-binding protein/permease [Candidatus Izemoplasmatales bacterium]